MKAKIIFFMALIILFTIFVTQNSKVIDINVFFWRYEMSAVVLISITGFIGLLLGFVLAKIFDSADRKKMKGKEKQKETKNSTKDEIKDANFNQPENN